MEFVHTSIEGEIATVTLDHRSGNRINFAMRSELLDAFEQVRASRARVLIVDAKGDDFSLGGDVREWLGVPAAELRPRVEMFAKALESMVTNTCIESTGRDAFERGYHITFVTDAVGAFSWEAHKAAIEQNWPRFAHEILSSAELVKLLENSSRAKVNQP